MAPPWTQAPERGATWTMRILFFVLNVLGYHVARALLRPIVAYFVISGTTSRRTSRDFFSRLHRFDPSAPKPTWMQVYLHHLEFAETLLERVLLWQGKSEHFEISGRGKELLEGEAGTGCLLFGAHFGSFDVLRVLTTELKSRVNVVMFRSHALRFNKFLEEINPEANLRVVELNPGEIEGVLKLKTCIEQGEHVAILADRMAPQTAPMGRQRVSNITFLGSEAPFPESPWILARVLNCPVLFVCAERTGARSYDVTVDLLARKISGHSDITNHMHDFARRLESLCCRRPKQWFNFYNFWSSAERNAS